MGVRYNWQESSPIKQMEVAKTLAGRVQAIIYAPDNTSDQAATLPQYLAKHGFYCYLDEVGGKNVLKVVAFGKEEGHLLDSLRSGGFIAGEASETSFPDKKIQLSTVDKLRKNSLNITGIFGDVGHAAMMVSGALEGDKNRIATSALYGTSATIQALFGAGADDPYFSQMTSQMRDYLEKKGINLSDPVIKTPEVKYRDRSLRTKVYDFIRRHPIQASQAISLTGNLSLFQSGLREIRNYGTGFGRLFAGMVTATSALIVMFVPQATPKELEEHKKEKGVFKTLAEGHVIEAVKKIPHRAFMLIRKSPLAFQGMLLLSDNMGMLFDAYQTNQKYKVWKEGGTAPPGIKDSIRTLFTGKKPVGVHQDSHYQRIAALDEQLKTMNINYDPNKPDMAIKGHRIAEDLIKQRKELNQQIKGLEKIPFGAFFSWLTAITYTTASAFNTLASKNRPAGFESKEVHNELYTYAANTILDLPASEQDRVIKKMASYLSDKHDVHVTEKEIETGIKSKLAILKQSPWLKNVIAIDEADKKVDNTVPPEIAKKENRSWTERVAADTDLAAAAAAAPVAPLRP